MNPRHSAWWLLPIFGILAGLVFRPSEDLVLPHPEDVKVDSRMLVLPDGRALRFLRGPSMSVFLSETEVPRHWLQDLQHQPPSHSDALAYAELLSEITGTSLRLPTAEEWRTAARAGVTNAEFPWGFGPSRPDDILFGLDRIPEKPGPAFGYGFRDLAGGVWEWTQEGILLGSAWSEQNPGTLRIDHEWLPPETYRGKDVGLRLVWE